MASSPRFTRYMMRELAMPTLLGLLLYTFVLLMNHFFLVAEKALAKNLPTELTLRLFAVGIPKVLIMSIPMAVLLGTLIALGRLSSDQEWTALQAAGQGPSAVLRPVLLHGLMGALASLVIYAVVIPQTHYAGRNIGAEVIFSSNLASDLRAREFYELPDSALLYVDDIRASGERRLQNVFLAQPDPEREGKTKIFVARYGDLYPAPDGSGALVFDLYEGEAHSYRTQEPEKYLFFVSDAFEGNRLEPFRFLRTLMTPPSKVAQDLTMGELLQEIREAEKDRAEQLARPGSAGRGMTLVKQRRVAAAQIELHRRIALPLASLFFAFLALPLGLTTARSGKGAGFALSVVVIILYRVVFVTSTNQALNGRIPAQLGPWVANAVVLLWALVAFWRMRRGTLWAGGNPITRVLDLGRALARFKPKGGEADVPLDSDLATSDLAALGGSGRRFIGRLDRYVAMAFLRSFALALVSIYLLYAVVEGQELVDRSIRTNQPIALVGEYLAYFAPGVLHVVLPISCLIGAIVSITLLSRTSELVAIRAAGVSLRRVTLPILLLTLLFGAVLFLVQDRIAPPANRKAQGIKDRIQRRAPRTHGLPATGSWRFGSGGVDLYHFRMHDPSKDVYHGLSVFTFDRSAARPRIAGHRFSEVARSRADGMWELEGGWFRSFDVVEGIRDPTKAAHIDSILNSYEEPYELELDLPADLMDERRWLAPRGDEVPEEVSVTELKYKIESLRNSGYDITKLRVAYYRRFAEALAPLVMVLLGLPFAFRVGRRGSLYGIGVALLLVLVYWATFAVFNALGLETVLPPPVAAWAPNALFALLGTYLLLYVRT